MNQLPIIITGIHIDLTDAIHTIVHEKMAKLFQHNTRIVQIRVELTQDSNKLDHKTFMAQGIVELPGPNLIVTTDSDDLYRAIDDLELQLLRKLRQRARMARSKRKQPAY